MITHFFERQMMNHTANEENDSGEVPQNPMSFWTAFRVIITATYLPCLIILLLFAIQNPDALTKVGGLGFLIMPSSLFIVIMIAAGLENLIAFSIPVFIAVLAVLAHFARISWSLLIAIAVISALISTLSAGLAIGLASPGW